MTMNKIGHLTPHMAIRSKTNTTGAILAKGTIVRLAAADGNGCALPALTTDALYGVVLHDCAIGGEADIQTDGITQVLAGGALANGALLGSLVTGKARAHVAADGFLGTACSAATAADELIWVDLAGPGVTR